MNPDHDVANVAGARWGMPLLSTTLLCGRLA